MAIAYAGFIPFVSQRKKGEGLEPEDMSRKCMIYWERKRLYRFGFICIVMQAPFLGSEKNISFYLDTKCSLYFCLDNDKAFRLYFLDFQVNSFLLLDICSLLVYARRSLTNYPRSKTKTCHWSFHVRRDYARLHHRTESKNFFCFYCSCEAKNCLAR